MARVQERQPEAGPGAETFEQLFERYQTRIFNLVYRIVGDYEEAADLTSEIFLAAYRGFEHFRGESHTYTWLYRIAINTCRNHFRRQARRSAQQAPAEERGGKHDLSAQAEWPDWSQSPQHVYEQQELHQQVHACIGALPEDLRLAVVLRDLQGLSYQEMAEALDCSLETIKSRLFRARRILAQKLAPYLQTDA